MLERPGGHNGYVKLPKWSSANTTVVRMVSVETYYDVDFWYIFDLARRGYTFVISMSTFY